MVYNMNYKLIEKTDKNMKVLGYDIKMERSPYFDYYYAIQNKRRIFLRKISQNEKLIRKLEDILTEHEAYEIIDSCEENNIKLVNLVREMDISAMRSKIEEAISLKLSEIDLNE